MLVYMHRQYTKYAAQPPFSLCRGVSYTDTLHQAFPYALATDNPFPTLKSSLGTFIEHLVGIPLPPQNS